MNAKRAAAPIAALIVDVTVRAAIASALATRAREIQARDKCSDDEAIERAMLEYDRIVLEAQQRRDDLKEAQERQRREDELRAQGKPTLKVSLGDVVGLAALRAKLPPGPR